MIDFNNLNVTRLIIHTITAKKLGADSASVTTVGDLISVEDSVLHILKTRLTTAAGRNSKAFELEIENTDPDSFFDISASLHSLSNPDFISRSKDIAELLADSQKRTTIPGGYLLIMDCQDASTGQPCVIAIKAEPHDALLLSEDGLTVLQEIFLSPSQRLYKLGAIYKLPETNPSSGSSYGCFLFDDQFRADSQPAEYFYKDFLGFSVSNNAKIQTQRFYEKTLLFVINNVDNNELKISLLSALRNELRINQSDVIDPMSFASTFIPAGTLRDKYIDEVCGEFETSIVKDITLVKSRLYKRKLSFPENINVSGPEEQFDGQVEIIDSINELGSLDVNSSSYTIVKIKGKPYPSTNE